MNEVNPKPLAGQQQWEILRIVSPNQKAIGINNQDRD
jgi:hypothetical protein